MKTLRFNNFGLFRMNKNNMTMLKTIRPSTWSS